MLFLMLGAGISTPPTEITGYAYNAAQVERKERAAVVPRKRREAVVPAKVRAAKSE